MTSKALQSDFDGEALRVFEKLSKDGPKLGGF